MNHQRCEILCYYYCKRRDKHVTEWLPGYLIETHGNGRHTIRTDNGFYTTDAAPECVRLP